MKDGSASSDGYEDLYYNEVEKANEAMVTPPPVTKNRLPNVRQ